MGSETESQLKSVQGSDVGSAPLGASAAVAADTSTFGEVARRDFPALSGDHVDRALVYLDTAATAQKPQVVLDAITDYYTNANANVSRGIHTLAERSTDAFETARTRVADFVGCAAADEIVFVRGTTEAANLVAQSWGRTNVRAGDRIVVTAMEHHSNWLPWQRLCESTGAELVVIATDDAGNLDIDHLTEALETPTKLLAVTHASNVLGTINPIATICELAHAANARVFVDGAQSAPHLPIDVRALGCDFFAFSGHKLYGPMGIGALYVRREILDGMDPWQLGGGMVLEAGTSSNVEGAVPATASWMNGPARFEAGTPNVAGAVGLAAAMNYLEKQDTAARQSHEQDLLRYATAALEEVPGLRILGQAETKVALVTFTIDGVHPHDLATVLDSKGVAIRSGHHCAQPLHDRFGISASARVSFGLYNTRTDVDCLSHALTHALSVLAP